jgi:hypothetical protein
LVGEHGCLVFLACAPVLPSLRFSPQVAASEKVRVPAPGAGESCGKVKSACVTPSGQEQSVVSPKPAHGPTVPEAALNVALKMPARGRLRGFWVTVCPGRPRTGAPGRLRLWCSRGRDSEGGAAPADRTG